MWRTSSYWYVDIFLIELGKIATLSYKVERFVSSLGNTFNGSSKMCQMLPNLCCQVWWWVSQISSYVFSRSFGCDICCIWPKWHNITIYWNIYQSTTVSEICKDLPLFEYLSLGNLSFSWYLSSINSSTMEKFWNFLMVLEFYQKFSGKFESYFFKELKFIELKLHGKVKFHKLEFQKRGRLLNISQTVIYCKIFCKRVVFGHFGLLHLLLY